MQLDGATPSLVDETRFLVGDEDGNANTLFSDSQVKNRLNDSYLMRMDQVQAMDIGRGNKRSYFTTVDGQVFYEKPSDLVNFVSVEISTTGQNLTSASVSAANIAYLEESVEDIALRQYNQNELSAPKFWFIHGPDHFGIVSPVDSTGAGTNSGRLVYEADDARLSADADEPFLPEAFHILLCYDAAIALKAARDMDTRALVNNPIYAMLNRDFKGRFATYQKNYEGKMIVAGLNGPGLKTKTGTVSRR